MFISILERNSECAAAEVQIAVRSDSHPACPLEHSELGCLPWKPSQQPAAALGTAPP